MKRLCFIFFVSLLIPYITTLFCVYSMGDNEPKERICTYRSVYLDRDGNKKMMNVEEYLPGTVAAEIDVKYGYEAVRAQAIIARTYIYMQMKDKSFVPESALDMDHMDISDMEKYWGENSTENYSIICDAVNSTRGEIMLYDGEYVLPLYHEISAGITRMGNAPYIQPAESREDVNAEGYLHIKEWKAEEMADKINSISDMPKVSKDMMYEIEIKEKENGGYIRQISIGNDIYSGEQIKDALGLPSSSFIIENYGGVLRTVTKGIGHGYGMSQYGAYKMAMDGKTAEDILNYYYKNIQIISE